MAEETTRQEQAAGATILAESIKGATVKYLVWLQNKGRSPSTISSRMTHLNVLTHEGANILDPESVNQTLAKQRSWSESYKSQIVWTYIAFAQMMKITYEPPNYKQTERLPFIPTETELDQLIAACGKKTSTFLQTAKETAARAGEIWKLQWTDLDEANNVLRITPEKNSKPRIMKISTKLTAMLNNLPKTSTRIFGESNIIGFRDNFNRAKKKISYRLSNPRFLQITFHTFRHWKATILYHKTKDIIYVKEFLGHKDLRNTMIYINVENAIYQQGSDDFTCKVAKTVDEAKQLIEVGFEYVTDVDGFRLFRKRK